MRKLTDRRLEQKLYIHETILTEVRLHLFSPLRGGIRYGALSELVNRLLKDWLATQRGGKPVDINPHVCDNSHIIEPPESLTDEHL